MREIRAERVTPLWLEAGQHADVTQIGVIQQRAVARAGKHDRGRQARHERQESKAVLPPRSPVAQADR
jgi:hypothetical protein